MLQFELGSRRPSRGVPTVAYVMRRRLGKRGARVVLVERREFHCGAEAYLWSRAVERKQVEQGRGKMFAFTAFIAPENDRGEAAVVEGMQNMLGE